MDMDCHFNLFQIAKVPIERHVKIRNAATPFDPQYQEYLVKRKLKGSLVTLGKSLSRLRYKLLGINDALVEA